jgi:predicted nucleotidyltransferase
MTTVSQMTREEWQPYIETLLRQPDVPVHTSDEQRRILLLSRVRQAAQLLKQQFAVQRVVLFGSLAHDAWFVAGSDVDLAVEGLDSAEYFSAWKLVEEALEGYPVDLVEIETASPGLRAAIDRQGIDL